MVKDLSVDLCGIRLQNPVVPASGTFGFGLELADSMDLNVIGGISLKGTTREARYGNPTPRIAECDGGMINSVGLQNPGIDVLVGEKVPALRKVYDGCVIANISGFSLDEYKECCAKADACEGIDIIEVNISCPNVHNGGMAFGTDPASAAEVTRTVKAVCKKPVFIKLSPNVTDIVAIARACEEAGADGLTLVNTFLGMRIDIARRKPVIANKMGGYSGRAVFPVALRKVYAGCVIANISGFSLDEYKECCAKADACDGIDIIEVNVSCPNVHNGGMAFGTSAASAAEVTAAVKAVCRKPVFLKLSPNVTDIVSIARACEDAGADGLTLVNTFLGMRIDIARRKPVIANKMGGISGRAVFPVALRMVYQVAHACRIPVMGCGGVASARDVVEMLMGGAAAVQVGAENIRNPFACPEIVAELPALMDELGINNLRDIIGTVA